MFGLAGVAPDGTCLDSCHADLSAFYNQTGRQDHLSTKNDNILLNI
jgi:hypothetical protein